MTPAAAPSTGAAAEVVVGTVASMPAGTSLRPHIAAQLCAASTRPDVSARALSFDNTRRIASELAVNPSLGSPGARCLVDWFLDNVDADIDLIVAGVVDPAVRDTLLRDDRRLDQVLCGAAWVPAQRIAVALDRIEVSEVPFALAALSRNTAGVGIAALPVELREAACAALARWYASEQYNGSRLALLCVDAAEAMAARGLAWFAPLPEGADADQLREAAESSGGGYRQLHVLVDLLGHPNSSPELRARCFSELVAQIDWATLKPELIVGAIIADAARRCADSCDLMALLAGEDSTRDAWRGAAPHVADRADATTRDRLAAALAGGGDAETAAALSGLLTQHPECLDQLDVARVADILSRFGLRCRGAIIDRIEQQCGDSVHVAVGLIAGGFDGTFGELYRVAAAGT
jgi:hypothetical protein